jgi:hypothetical protein
MTSLRLVFGFNTYDWIKKTITRVGPLIYIDYQIDADPTKAIPEYFRIAKSCFFDTLNNEVIEKIKEGYPEEYEEALNRVKKDIKAGHNSPEVMNNPQSRVNTLEVIFDLEFRLESIKYAPEHGENAYLIDYSY